MKLVYYLILKPLSYLPDFFIYRLSDLCSFALFYLIPYRKKLVLENLRKCFPEKRPKEISRIARSFYTNFTDVMLEILKGFSLNEKGAQRRIRVINPEVLDDLYDQGKSVLITGGHYVNWESITVSADRMKHDMYGLFTPISNKFIEKRVTESRSRFTFNMVSTKKYKASLEENFERPRAYVFAVDQSPKAGSGHWMKFLGRDTAVLYGTERTAKEFDMPVVAGLLRRRSRGKYDLRYEVLFNHPRQTEQYEITETCMRVVEKQIIEQPAHWLWTHRRWKHKKPKT